MLNRTAPLVRYERSVAYTMPATPRSGVGISYNTGGPGAIRSRYLRGSVGVRSGDGAGSKGLSLPGATATRTCSTLPRMSARQLQQPIPHATPSFMRPTSAFVSPSAPPIPSRSRLLSHQGQGFQPPLITAITHSSTAATTSAPLPESAGGPPPLPPRTYYISDNYMDDLCKRITDQALPDGMFRNHGML